MSLSARLGKLVGLFAPGTRLAHGERMYAAARPTEDAAGWLPLDRNVNDVVRASSPVVRAACASWCATSPISTGR